MMQYALVKTIFGGGVLLIEYKNPAFPIIDVSKVLDLSTLIIAVTSKVAPKSKLSLTGKIKFNLSYYEEIISESLNIPFTIDNGIDLDRELERVRKLKLPKGEKGALENILNNRAMHLAQPTTICCGSSDLCFD